MKIGCYFVTLVFIWMLTEVSGYCKAKKELWERYREAYDINSFDSEYRFYARINRDVSNGLTGNYRVCGVEYDLPAAATLIFLYTKDTIPYWFFSSERLIIYHYFYGSPLKVSTLQANGSITVQYLGNKFDPFCEHLNCQHEIVVSGVTYQKKELVDPNGWSIFLSVLAPYTEGIEETRALLSDSNLRCEFDGY